MNKKIQWRTGVTSLILVAALAVPLFLSRVVVASGEVFTTAANKTTYQNQTVSVTDLQINGTGNDLLDMNLHVNEGNLQFNSTVGLTFDGPSNGATLQFSGTRTNINTALSSLQYKSSTAGSKTVEATLGGGDGDVYNPDNKHVYQVVNVADPGINWNDAKVAAEAMTYGGVPGYLATVTSQGETDFIQSRLNDNGWVGASDAETEGVWKWVTGPEAGLTFWNGDGATGSTAPGQYSHWNPNEPNNSAPAENCAEFRAGEGGRLNDLSCSSYYRPSYVVEFGSPGNLPTVASTNFDITVNTAPVIAFTALSPADNSTVGTVNSVSITFNQPMRTGEGEIKIFDSADDSMVASTFNGGTDDDLTFTFELSEPLTSGKSYYVNVSDSFFEGLVTYYHGFSDKTTWNFMVGDTDGVSDAIENAAPNSGDGNNDGVQDSLQGNVTSLVDPVTGKYATLAVDAECDITSISIGAENSNQLDGAYDYPAGLMDFSLDCGTPGHVATITQYYYGVTGNFVVRKYNPTTNKYTTITGASVADQTIAGNQVKVATYQVADGGDLDLDGIQNGKIVDPAGLAVSVSISTNLQGLAKTGSSPILGILAGGVLTLGGLLTTRQLKKAD